MLTYENVMPYTSSAQLLTAIYPVGSASHKDNRKSSTSTYYGYVIPDEKLQLKSAVCFYFCQSSLCVELVLRVNIMHLRNEQIRIYGRHINSDQYKWLSRILMLHSVNHLIIIQFRFTTVCSIISTFTLMGSIYYLLYLCNFNHPSLW